MPVERIEAHPSVREDCGRVALQRGPIVYCAEAVDNGGRVANLVLPDDTALESHHLESLLGGVTVLTGRALGLRADVTSSASARSMADEVAAAHGGIDALVYCAAALTPFALAA